MVVTREYNYSGRNGLQIITESRTVEDSNIRVTIQMQIHRRLAKIYELTKKRECQFKLIQHYQLLALTTDDDIEARKTVEYYTMILIPELHTTEREIQALERQVEALRAKM